MKKIFAVLIALTILLGVAINVNAARIEKPYTLNLIDGKQAAYYLLHTKLVENFTEEDIIKLYYKVYLDQEATDWDVEFWSQRITPEDTTLLTYGMINSNAFEAKCEKLGLNYTEYFIENGVFTEGFSPISEECGLTKYGDYVFYATFGDATYYHVVRGAVDYK